ncbi:MAG: glycerol-3-phosphate responsive antiterminator [Treponema sp.]|nr:glycerol-3-phosphate responsive antiterminator [Treponema sp.]
MRSILIKKRNCLGPDEFYELLRLTPVISAVKSMEDLEKSLTLGSRIVFVLFGDLLTIPNIVGRLKSAGKVVMIHIDLIEGLSAKEVAVDYLWENTGADGILSTKPNLIKHAKNRGFLTIQRFFVLDSMALVNIEKQFPLEYADAMEILPGVMPKVIAKIVHITKKPIIAGGLVSDEEDVRNSLKAGAVSVSSTNPDLIRP